MIVENRERTKMQLLTAIIWATLLFNFVLGAKSEVAVGQDASFPQSEADTGRSC